MLAALPSGSGLCTRAGFTVDLQWKDGKLLDARIHPKLGLPLTVRYAHKEQPVEIA